MLIVASDHRRLVKILDYRKLKEISNPRFPDLNEYCLRHRYELVRPPGRYHQGSDAMSLYPVAESTVYIVP